MEYVLLGSLVALVGILGFQLIGSNMNTAYRSWDNSVQDRWDLNADLPPATSGS